MAIFVQMIDLFRPKNLFFMNLWVDWQKWAISRQFFLLFLTNLYIFANYQSCHSPSLDVDSNSKHGEHHSKSHEDGRDHRQRKVLRKRSHIFRFRHLLQEYLLLAQNLIFRYLDEKVSRWAESGDHEKERDGGIHRWVDWRVVRWESHVLKILKRK